MTARWTPRTRPWRRTPPTRTAPKLASSTATTASCS
ncbi:hypothetical protein CRUP_021439 [Coryphaenoides rupestris]|nr:hypothetical protein CRUP_021439 [Coryphaenoides rupestris]